jgi:hypothetical protein
MRNINIPKARVFIRCDAFGGSPDEFEPAWLISARALRNRPLCFQAWIDRFAACYDKIPPHCLYWFVPEENHTPLTLHLIQVWECLSGSIECWQKAQLADVPVMVNLGKGNGTAAGHYWFTIDYLPEGQAGGILDIGDADLLEEHKEANMIKLSNGQVAIYPNNRLKWLPVSLTPEGASARIPAWDAASNAQWDEWWEDSGEVLGDAKWAY